MSSMIDTIYTFRFLKILSTKWTNTDAFKYGIIDKDGEPLKNSKDLTTQKEKDAYNSFIRLIFKLKRLMGTIPGGQSAVARYGAAIALIKENKDEVKRMGLDMGLLLDNVGDYINEETANGVSGVEGKEEPLSDKKKEKKDTKEEPKETKDTKDTKKKKDTDKVTEVDTNVREGVSYQLIGNALIRVDEMKRTLKKRVINGKRVKRREVTGSKRKTRTGGKKLRGSAKSKWKRSHKKAYRKAHTASAQHKRARSMKKSTRFNK